MGRVVDLYDIGKFYLHQYKKTEDYTRELLLGIDRFTFSVDLRGNDFYDYIGLYSVDIVAVKQTDIEISQMEVHCDLLFLNYYDSSKYDFSVILNIESCNRMSRAFKSDREAVMESLAELLRIGYRDSLKLNTNLGDYGELKSGLYIEIGDYNVDLVRSQLLSLQKAGIKARLGVNVTINESKGNEEKYKLLGEVYHNLYLYSTSGIIHISINNNNYDNYDNISQIIKYMKPSCKEQFTSSLQMYYLNHKIDTNKLNELKDYFTDVYCIS